MGPPLGAHASVAGGYHRALERGAERGYEAIQIFVKNPNRWREREPPPEAFTTFRAARRGGPIGPVIAHASYLINLAATDRTTLRRSRRALAEELERCDRLGVDALVLHPGAHLGRGVDRGVAAVAASIDHVLAGRRGGTRLLLENTAGQGTVLGASLEELAAIRSALSTERAVGVCIDTCHVFAAGHPIHHRPGYERFVERLLDLFAGDLGCIHLNDSRHPCGSHRDRHANLGEGEIGAALFRRLVTDGRFAHVPMVLETPLGDDGEGHRRDLKNLLRWRRAKRGQALQ